MCQFHKIYTDLFLFEKLRSYASRKTFKEIMLQNDGNTNQQASINAFLLKNTIDIRTITR